MQRSSSHGHFCTERRRRRSQIPGIPAFLLLSCHVHHWSRSKTTLHFETCLTMYKSWRWKVNFRTEPFCIAATPQILNVPAFLILSWYVHHWKKKKKFDLETWNSIFYIQRYSQRTNFRIVQCKLKEPQRKYTQCILVMVRLVAFFISFVLVFHFRAAFSNHHEGVFARAINLLSHIHCNIQMKIVGGIFFSILQRYIAECRALNLVKASIRASWPWSDTRGARLNYSWNLFFYSKVKRE